MSEDIVREFLVESNENLDSLDRELVQLEKNPGDRETLASIFRTIHTIKGTCGFLGFPKLQAVANAGENLLSRLRDGELALNPEITTGLLQMVDAIRQMLASIESSGSEGQRYDQELIKALVKLQQSQPKTAGTEVERSKPQSGGEQPLPEASPNIGEILIQSGMVGPEDVKAAVEQQNAGDPRHLGEILVEKGAIKPQDVVDALNTQQQVRAQNTAGDTIRVDVAHLDNLMNLVGELVLARNQIVQFTNATEDNALTASSQRLNLITTELQEGVMKTRMQPIGNIWSKFPRTVRDVAAACGKRIRIEMEGKGTELDKTIIEAIKDPLTHIVRNSADHGIESPEKRVAAGKPAEGRLLLRAYHEGGQVIIEIADDGAGLDHERIRRVALDKGLITPGQAARMGERESVNLIFLPGLSTAETVTNVSGRGVGLDVVRTNIEKIGGTVDVQSIAGQGMTVRMKIPLTLAIIPALMVTSAGDRYAIPQVNLLELVRLEGARVREGIELVQGAPVYRLRGRLLPLVYLNSELKVGDNRAGGAEKACAEVNNGGEEKQAQLQLKKVDEVSQRTIALTRSVEEKVVERWNVNIVVLRADDRQFGLVVDDINDTEEIVVKPLSKRLKSINMYAGATIMGDGKVALILDVLGLAQCAHVVSGTHDRALAEGEGRQPMAGEAGHLKPVLLFQYNEDRRMAIDLSMVSRLEEFKADAIEIADGHEAVQYRGQIMPLVRVADVLEGENNHRTEPPQSIQVVVYAEPGRNIGLVIDRIPDIAEEAFVIERQRDRKGVLGSAVIQKRITDVLDVPGLIAASLGSHPVAM
jgi:two-component system chemotaxis sensor kinase CheA